MLLRKPNGLILPETTIDDQINESDFNTDKYLLRLKEFLGHHNDISILIGATTFSFETDGNSQTLPNSAPDGKGELKRDIYNSALMIDTGIKTGAYHKSKLVPGFEKQLTGIAGKIITNFLPYLGGTQSGYTVQKERTVFEQKVTGQKIGPVICFESVYGEFVSELVKNGAEFLFIITNDGWWKNTNGYMHHLSFASLRAIESRRSIARAANTGVSCIVEPSGEIKVRSDWWQPAVIKANLTESAIITTYVRYGDYLYKADVLVSIIVILIVFVISPLRRRNKLLK